MNKVLLIILIVFAFGCSTKEKYDVGNFLDRTEQDSVLIGIIAHIYSAPPYTLMQDRLKPEHRHFYAGLIPRFHLEKYFISQTGVNYFYLIRPGSKSGDQRAVGGYFKRGANFALTGFHEVFVSPVLPEAELKGRVAFLFDEMVKGTIEPYLKMDTYVQWPNGGSAYDTVSHEWESTVNK